MPSCCAQTVAWNFRSAPQTVQGILADCAMPRAAQCSSVVVRVTGMIVDDVAWSDVCMHAADSVTRAVLKHLPFVKDVFRNKREDYHLTIWHTSKAMYPCPDATHKTGGVDPGVPPGERPAPTPVRVSACMHVLTIKPRPPWIRTYTLLPRKAAQYWWCVVVRTAACG